MEEKDFYKQMLDLQGKVLEGQQEQEKRVTDRLDKMRDRQEENQHCVVGKIDVVKQDIGDVQLKIAKVGGQVDAHINGHRKLAGKTVGLGAASGTAAAGTIWGIVKIIEIFKDLFHNGY